MPDTPKHWTARTLSRFLALATVVAALLIGFLPIQVERGPDGTVACEALLLPVDGVSVDRPGAVDDPDLDDLDWLLRITATQLAEESLCEQARQGRLAWLVLVTGLGAAASLAAGAAYRRDESSAASSTSQTEA
ncbi:hypothetical protein ET445_03330 [Agromyces protaetiae]|uniref:Transmembrane protein n=1 Tax=Agromyces protaetiae TaxID=2509455 RepID=A0A4P6FA95_9MICO|nr:hypothetical protein [Agromyces protaetiae]QAY72516.1 hypothetical protein ET445_03330 [Agromyces protaetiae]